MTVKTYRAVVTRESGAWLADVPGLPGTHTFARNIPSLQRAVRELIALVEDLPDGAEDDLDVEYEYRIGIPEVEAATRQLRADRERIRREEDELARRTDAAAKALVERYKFSVRDAAALTGVSKQRISQLAPSKEATNRAARQAASGRKTTAAARSSSKAPSATKSGLTGRYVAKSGKTGRAITSSGAFGKGKVR